MPTTKVENIHRPGKTYAVNAAKQAAMQAAVLSVLPTSAPGLTPAEIIAAVKPILPQDLFPGGEKAGWWVKSVQLDLEARGVIRRADRPPVRLWRV